MRCPECSQKGIWINLQQVATRNNGKVRCMRCYRCGYQEDNQEVIIRRERMKRIIVIESEDVELLNRFADIIDKKVEELKDIEEWRLDVFHFKGDEL